MKLNISFLVLITSTMIFTACKQTHVSPNKFKNGLCFRHVSDEVSVEFEIPDCIKFERSWNQQEIITLLRPPLIKVILLKEFHSSLPLVQKGAMVWCQTLLTCYAYTMKNVWILSVIFPKKNI